MGARSRGVPSVVVDESGRAASTGRPDRAADWWREGVFYQVYPRSFGDGNGDGVGDLAGILEHLDHLERGPDGLGIDAIWLSPIYPSPGLDGGYDVTDHASVDPVLGSRADFDELVAEAHRRGIQVVLDLVLNHTSDQHPWFKSSRTGRDGPHADWYIWADPAGHTAAGRPRPPNNWRSVFGGSAWAFEPARGQFYLHTFLAEQPDVNWRQPELADAQLAMVQGWLDRGVDGFRLDVFNLLVKDERLRSNPVAPGRGPESARLIHRQDKDQPGLRDILARLRALVDAEPGRMTVGELFDANPSLAAGYSEERHLIFDFLLLFQPWSADAFRSAILEQEAAFGPARWPTVVFGNHDQSRPATRWAGDRDPDAVARAAAMLLLTLRGTPFLYYGDEIGMRDVKVPRTEAQDPQGRRRTASAAGWNRDQCRSPMPWCGRPRGGFTTGHPWMRLGSDIATRNVARELADPDSILRLYQRLVRARQATPALHGGDLEVLTSSAPELLLYRRRAGESDALVVVNFSDQPVTGRIDVEVGVRWCPLVTTHLDGPPEFEDGAAVTLAGLDGAIFVPVPGAARREA